MSHQTPGQLAEVDAFKCRNCGYIHTTHDGEKPPQCVDCGAQSFQPVSDDATNRTEENRGILATILAESSTKTLIAYLIFGLIFFGLLGISLFVIFV